MRLADQRANWLAANGQDPGNTYADIQNLNDAVTGRANAVQQAQQAQSASDQQAQDALSGILSSEGGEVGGGTLATMQQYLPEEYPRFPHRKWVVFLMAYQGCRITEACQLQRPDIKKDATSGAWFMSVNMDDHAKGTGRIKSVKTAGSVRDVPLHPALIAEGFLDYVATIKSGALFPDIVPDKFGSAGGNVAKWYGRWLRDVVKITDPRLVAHSWRHRFKDMARNAGIPKEVFDALQGHEEGDSSGDYGEGYSIGFLNEAMKKIPVQV